MNRNLRRGFAVGVALSLGLTLIPGAVAFGGETSNSLLPWEVRKALVNLPDHYLPASALRQVSKPVTSDVGGTDAYVAISRNVSDPVRVSDGGETLSLGLPFQEKAAPFDLGEGIAGFDNGNSSWTVPVRRDDGSAQILTVLEGPEAPAEYMYELSIPDGGSATVVNNTVSVFDADGAYLGGVAAPWARDARGVSVETFFEIEGTTLTQFVGHKQDSSLEYPIVADPWLGMNLFSSITRNLYAGDYKYNMTRSSWGVAVHTGLAQGGGILGAVLGRDIFRGAGWDEVKGRYSAVTNKATLYQQYDCHIVWGYTEVEWNIERFRSNYPNWSFNPLSHQCNW